MAHPGSSLQKDFGTGQVGRSLRCVLETTCSPLKKGDNIDGHERFSSEFGIQHTSIPQLSLH